nr:coiled-coil-helix-coiled-coil-helix domain-containing protein 7 [Megalopta genalis]
MTKISPEGTQQKEHDSAARIPKRDQEIDNPCLQEHLLSLKCLDNNEYVQKRCEPYFENYKICKMFWRNVKKDRRLKGIKPELPLPEDRRKVKAEYIKTFVPE